MNNTTATTATTPATVHVLLHYVPDDNETYCRVFSSREAVVKSLRETITQDWEDEHYTGEEASEEDKEWLAKEIADMEKSMNERGYWRDVDGNEYVYDEKEVLD